MTPEMKIQQMGLALPEVAKPAGAYIPAVRTGNLIFTAGQLPMRDGKLIAAGKVPSPEVSLQQAQEAARQAVLNALAAVKAQIGSLDNIRQIVRLNVYVNSSAGFTEQAKVANGASELLGEIFGDCGKHTRCAVGVAELPLNATVELDLIMEINEPV